MNFLRMELAPGLVIGFILLAGLVILLERRLFKIIKTYWFYKRSLLSYVASFLFLAGMGTLLLSLLDARGPEEKIKTAAPTERTIILIDTSASMLAEDVKPSRLQKAVLVAKHFARKAAGHQIAVVVFAEIQKKIVPFTNDLDLIDARLETLKNLRNNYGSSALSVALQESIQYFKETGSEARGNILVLTDGEETADGVDLNVPKDIHVALVGIGTEQGGRIPMDDGRGLRYGYKKNGGKDVITKLNERFFEKVAADLPSAKYWIANSYTLPSDEIVEFFKGETVKGQDEQDMIIRPVMMEWIVLPALGLLILSYFFKALRIFTLGLFLIVMPIHAQENAEGEKEIKLSPETISKLEDLQQGRLNQMQRLKLADDLQKQGALEESQQLYKENLPLDKIDKSIPPEAYLNYGTGLLQSKKTSDGLKMYDKLTNFLGEDEKSKEIKETMAKNTLSHFRMQQEQKKKDKEDQQKKKDQQNKDQQNQSGGTDNKDQKGEQGQQKKDQQNGQQKKPDQNKDQKGEDQKDKQDKDKGDEKKEDKDQGDKDEKDKKEGSPEEGEKKPMPPKKMPAKLKQLMSDDRQLQMKVIENGTRDLNKKKSRTSKDW